MHALNKSYTTRLNYPLVWSYDSLHYVPLRPLPATLPVTVTGQGWRLLRANLGWDTHPATLRPVPLPGTRYLPADAWRRGLQNALEGLQVSEWAGDTLRLTFDRYVSRRLPLVLVPDSALRYTVSFTPATVSFRGPASVVNELPDPYPLRSPQAAARTSTGEAETPVRTPAQVRPSVPTVRVRWQLRTAGRMPRQSRPSFPTTK